ncbi:MAG TPA: OmpA family protein [Candidatus Acidoferrales bacterium]|jgi:OOP family OmpA-OmpF porin|nr:OmpA family protein [Candidatus Acidoferrales bacterium]
MNRMRFGNFSIGLGLILAGLALAVVAAAQDTQIKGLITGRSGATMAVKTQDNETITVALTADTQVQEIEGAFKLRKKDLGMTALIPGLPVQVKGSMNDKHQLVADTVKFKGSDLKTAQDIQAGLAPTDQQVQANAAQIKATEQQTAAQQQEIAANQEKIAAEKAAIAAANKRFGELGEYNILGEVTVYFGNGKVTVDPQYQPQLMDLATKAKTIDAYIIQVQGYASAVGSAALNQKLSLERADNVLAFLEQNGQIPLTNILAPGAMGTSQQVAPNATTEGQAENRRVVVRILQNKGIAGT